MNSIILLPIKPEYSSKIFSGEKKVEFRRTKPIKKFRTVLVYESYPTRKIVGWFTVRKIVHSTPEDVWSKYKDVAGIDKKEYLEYCGDDDIYAFEIDKVHKFETPIDPYNIDRQFKAPQRFQYLDDIMVQVFIPDTDIVMEMIQ